ncbi:MAG TPA: potassium-transporting ATPase subunit KdpA [Polyangiaceae bacterium]|jgi:K+-transporting ATPase ATPase A chain|nr:potassium-transporting ATPase subunit KdpA [Polyangiaceae bacterium]
MSWHGWALMVVYVVALVALVKPLGAYMARVYEGDVHLLRTVERVVYRAMGTSDEEDMPWTKYAVAMLVFNVVGLLVVYAIQRLQGHLPLNPQALGAPDPHLAWNTATSFATNTNWQSYGGETTLSYASQMLALAVQNFVSAASGMAVLVALIRGLRSKQANAIGNFWVDLTRGTLYILVPISFVFALFLVSQGVVQTFANYVTTESGQVLALGPAASQIAIKDLGTNGGGFFNANSAHPFENPTPLANFVIMLSILAIPAALTHTFGKMVKDTRQGWAVLAAMFAIFLPLLWLCVSQEVQPSHALASFGLESSLGNMEGKEMRFGAPASALYATVTTCASNGSVNAMHDSFSPLGGLAPMWLIQLGEIVFGGVGSGLYGMLMFAIVAVFVAGLMVGRTPEYLGKKIEAYEMKMASLGILVPCACVLVFTAIAVVTEAGTKGMANPGAHGFSEVLYAYSSASNNNGSAFAGLGAATPFYDTTLGLAMFLGRFPIKIFALAMAGSLAKKKLVPASSGTLPTHTPLFVAMLVGVVVVVGALTFIPALALGPIVEHLALKNMGSP